VAKLMDLVCVFEISDYLDTYYVGYDLLLAIELVNSNIGLYLREIRLAHGHSRPNPNHNKIRTKSIEVSATNGQTQH